MKVIFSLLTLAVVASVNATQTNANFGYLYRGKFLPVKWATSMLDIRRGDKHSATFENKQFKVRKYTMASIHFSKLLKKPDTHTVEGLIVHERRSKQTGLVTFELYGKNGSLFAKVVPNKMEQYRFIQNGKSWRVNLVGSMQASDSYDPILRFIPPAGY